MGKIGIIAEYWNSYGTSFVNPNLIKATPHDKIVSNSFLVDSVFSQPHIYLIKDGWLDFFPDTLNQFNHTLVKEGEMFFIGNCWVNEYKKIPQ
ncbi:MAG: hypothetical protein IT232_08400 [Flavobacteriales bacterium]|nr:hypothetical protein [Flavobacteriales bacterium]